MKKISVFNQTFNEPLDFPGSEYYISAELYSEEEAVKVFNDYFKNGYDAFEKEFTIKDIQQDRVRWCCQYDYEDGESRCCWWTGATGKGSKPVWFVHLKLKEGGSNSSQG
jgi:hypothetical protein